MLSIHVHGDPSQSIEPLQVTLRTRRTADIIQPPKDFEHSGKCNGTHFDAQALMRTKAEVSVQAHITIKTDLVGVRECDRVPSCNNLEFGVLLES